MARFFCNVDHVATVREARKVSYPDPVRLARVAERAGVDGITVHLREDRRHIQDRDVRELRRVCETPLNLELAVSPEIVDICAEIGPDQATLVPERREEITTEGGLDVASGFDRLRAVTRRLQDRGIVVSLFIDPDRESLDRSREIGASHVELHTGRYANAQDPSAVARELELLRDAASYGQTLGLVINAGHGLHYTNTAPVAAIPGMRDLNIGHAIVAHALEVGMTAAIREMKTLVTAAGR